MDIVKREINSSMPLSQPPPSWFLNLPVTYRKTIRRRPWRLTAFKCPSDVMLEIPSLPLKYSELQNGRRLGIRFRYVSVLQRVKENYCTKTKGPTLGICLREELYLPWMFAMVKRKLIACIYTIIQAKDRLYGWIYLLIAFNEFNYPLTMFATTLSCNKVGSCLYRVIFFAPGC